MYVTCKKKNNKQIIIFIFYLHLGPQEKKETPLNFITKHNTLFEWCYVDNLITSHFGYLPQSIIGKSVFDYYNVEDLSIIKEIHENRMFFSFSLYN